MTVKLFYHIVSPPSRASMLVLKALGIPHELQVVNLFKAEHLKPEYIAANPQHTIPMLEDNGFFIWDSHAINAYLVDKYGKDDSLYPKDYAKRAVVNQRLHLDSGVLFASLRNITVPILRDRNLNPVPIEKLNLVEEGYSFIEQILEKGTKFIAADHLTIADFSIFTTLTALQMLVPTLTEELYPKTLQYMDECEKTIPDCREISDTGKEVWRKVFDKIGYKGTVPEANVKHKI